MMVNRVEEMIPEAITVEVLRNYTKEDDMTITLVANINRGRMSLKIKESKYHLVFEELAVIAGIVLRGQRAVIPEGLRADVMAVTHEGHPDVFYMLTQLRETVWWPGLTVDIKEYAATCQGCVVAIVGTDTPAMTERVTPERVSLARLILGRKIWTKLPAINLEKQTQEVEQARQRNQETQKQRKQTFDAKRGVKERIDLGPGNRMLEQKPRST